MNVRHKHADILIAIAEGKTVQYKTDENSEWLDWCQINWSPLSHYPEEKGWQWQIKPKDPVKKYKVAYCALDAGHEYTSITNDYWQSEEEFRALACNNAKWVVLLEPTMKEFAE